MNALFLLVDMVACAISFGRWQKSTAAGWFMLFLLFSLEDTIARHA